MIEAAGHSSQENLFFGCLLAGPVVETFAWAEDLDFEAGFQGLTLVSF